MTKFESTTYQQEIKIEPFQIYVASEAGKVNLFLTLSLHASPISLNSSKMSSAFLLREDLPNSIIPNA